MKSARSGWLKAKAALHIGQRVRPEELVAAVVRLILFVHADHVEARFLVALGAAASAAEKV
jgi:hypothetical protein